MKTFIVLALSFTANFASAKPVYSAQLFDIIDNKLKPATEVNDSVFTYEVNELSCDAIDEETPCTAANDHWTSICFKGEIEAVCSEFSKLFEQTTQQSIAQGSEEGVDLKSCSSESGITVLSYVLTSFHGGPDVAIKNKLIPMCPIFF